MTALERLNRTALEHLKAQLWPEASGTSELKVYAVLDGARDEAVVATVQASGLASACLYAGQLPRPLVEVAPYLVQLDRDAPESDRLLERCWGNSWGVFALSVVAMEDLRRHFRRFLRAKDEDGNTFVFRWYDPRVLRVYLPTCSKDELRTLFGPVSLYLLEDELLENEAPASLLRFHRSQDGTLGRDITPLDLPA